MVELELESDEGAEEEAEYSDDFSAFASTFLNPELPESERIAALKEAIMACQEVKSDKPAAKGGGGLALVFGGGGSKKKGG